MGDEVTLGRLANPKKGVLTQIVEENTPEGLHKIVPEIVERIDAIVGEVAYTCWTSSDSGDKSVRRHLRAVLENYALPIKGEPFDRTEQIRVWRADRRFEITAKKDTNLRLNPYAVN